MLEHTTLSPNSSDPAGPTDLQELSSCEAEPGSSRSFRLLIVEDDWVLALELQSCLQSLGHVVVGMAATAPAAVEAAETHRPDLVLMDVRLANGTNGIDAASEIQKRLGILSIFMTASADVQTRAQVAQIRSLELLSKPVTLNAIAAALNRAAKGIPVGVQPSMCRPCPLLTRLSDSLVTHLNVATGPSPCKGRKSILTGRRHSVK
nr:response regulator [Methylobacterium sp. Leaf122]